MKGFRPFARRGAGFVALVVLILISVLPAAAQGTDLSITQGMLRLWPEYDDPGLLVILSGDFADTATFPQKVAFPVAAGARNIQATANDPTRGLLSQPWQMEGGKLTYTLPQPGFQIEYYVDRPPSGNQREITYSFEAPYAMNSLEIAVQQPARATDFTVTPKPISTTQGADGLTYHVVRLENLKAGDKQDITISYVKPDSGLTAPQLALPSGTPAVQTQAPAPAQTTPTNWLPYLLIGLGLLVLVGLGVYWFLQQRQPVRPAPETRQTVQPKTTEPTTVRPPVDAGVAFCTQCGRALRPDDRFCAQCGTPRKG
jgi:hypothetical protein